jgi:hypothetical protein
MTSTAMNHYHGADLSWRASSTPIIGIGAGNLTDFWIAVATRLHVFLRGEWQRRLIGGILLACLNGRICGCSDSSYGKEDGQNSDSFLHIDLLVISVTGMARIKLPDN